jgi:TusA-related sulfurtransferase
LVLGLHLEREVRGKYPVFSLWQAHFYERKKGESSVSAADLELDITSEVCPMTFVRTKLALERLAIGEILRIRLRDGEPKRNVPHAVRDHGHEIISLSPVANDLYELTIRKRR